MEKVELCIKSDSSGYIVIMIAISLNIIISEMCIALYFEEFKDAY